MGLRSISGYQLTHKGRSGTLCPENSGKGGALTNLNGEFRLPKRRARCPPRAFGQNSTVSRNADNGAVSIAELTSREAVLSALDEFDLLGRAEFLKKYGFSPARSYFIRRNSTLYDSKAVVGAAVGYEHAERGPMKSSEFSGGEATVKAKLEELGFEVTNTDAKPTAGASEAIPGGGELLLPQGEVDAFAKYLGTDEYRRDERDYKVAVHYVLGSLLSPERLRDPEFPTMLGAFFDGTLDLDQLGLAEEKRTFIESTVGSIHGVRAALTNLCGGGFGVNNFIWIPGAIRDGLGEEIGQIFADLVTSDAAVSERVDRFRSAFVEIEERAAQLPSWHENWTIVAASLSFVAAVLTAVDPHRFTFYLSGKLKPAYEEFVGEWPGGTLGERYEQVVSFVVDVRHALKRQGAPVRDMIDAQSFLYLRETIGESLAASVERFRAEYPYNEEDKQDRAVASLALAAETRPALTPEALEAPDWDTIAHLIGSELHGNLGPAKSKPLNLIEAGSDEDRQTFANAIRELLHGKGDLATRLANFLAADLPGIRQTVAMKLLSVWEPNRVLHVFKVHGHNGKAELMALPPLNLELPEANSTAELQIKSNDLIRDRLEPYFEDDCFGMTRYVYWVAEESPENVDGEGEGVETNIEGLASVLYLDQGGWLEDAVDLLKRKRQLIFYGPPGTGKTYIARALAKHLAPEKLQREVVQFHPSYSYEDFVRGYRPHTGTGGELSYVLEDGPLVRLAERARQAEEDGTDERFILLIDEINRGNLPRVFGELLYLLEYRGQDEDGLQLLYPRLDENGQVEPPFKLPENLWIIGTMNTADRSIGLIDAALRRRFHFKPLFPGEDPIEQTLGKWLDDNGLGHMKQEVTRAVTRLNDRLAQRGGAFGENLKIGHSYFMETDLDSELLDRIWESDVLPYLEEQLFGQDVNVTDEYSLSNLDSASFGGLGQEANSQDEDGAGSDDAG